MDLVLRESFLKRYPVISPSLMIPEWSDLLKFQFNPVFDLGFSEFTDPDYEHYATLLNGISYLDVLFGDDPLKPERPLSKRFKHCAYAEEAKSAASALKDVTNHKRFGPITTSPEREKAAHGVIPSNTVAEFSGGTKPVLGSLQPNPLAYTFSGSFFNCTINVPLK